jgi:hypothetical protein
VCLLDGVTPQWNPTPRQVRDERGTRRRAKKTIKIADGDANCVTIGKAG